MDNASFHKGEAIRTAIESRAARITLTTLAGPRRNRGGLLGDEGVVASQPGLRAWRALG